MGSDASSFFYFTLKMVFIVFVDIFLSVGFDSLKNNDFLLSYPQSKRNYVICGKINSYKRVISCRVTPLCIHIYGVAGH